jgi:CelD/BcsL family acetyltransferase involved in cellulose biosynthesis
VQWCGIRHRSPRPQLLADRPTQLIWQREVPLYHLDLQSSWDALRARLPRNIKESLRKCYNSLKRDGHAFKLVVRARPDEAEAAINRFLALHADRSQFAASVHHHDAFGTEPARGFLHDYARHMAQRDALRVFQLEIAGQVVATRIGFVLGDALYLYYSGYDVQWRQYSVMTTLVCEAIKWAIDHRFAVVNLSTGNDVSKTRWRPKETMFHEAMLTAPNMRAKLAFRLTSALRRRQFDPAKAVPEPEPATATETFSAQTTQLEPAPSRSNGAPRTLA